MKLLIIEDDKELTGVMSHYLNDEAYTCEIAADVQSALQRIASFDYHCILLDISLPNGNGLKVLKRLLISKKSRNIIIISDKNPDAYKEELLSYDANDLLLKPFKLSELGNKVASVIQHTKFGGNTVIKINELVLNIEAKVVTVHDKPIDLTRKEYDILLYFMSNRNHVISKNTIARHIARHQKEVFENFDIIYTHIKNLKRKLQKAGCDEYIKSVYGMGYKFTA